MFGRRFLTLPLRIRFPSRKSTAAVGSFNTFYNGICTQFDSGFVSERAALPLHEVILGDDTRTELDTLQVFIVIKKWRCSYNTVKR